jgi:hypothetical protein
VNLMLRSEKHFYVCCTRTEECQDRCTWFKLLDNGVAPWYTR